MPAAASLIELLSRSIDYAGLFPPCSLELKPALENQAKYARTEDRWMLATFVLPAARLEEAGTHLSLFDSEHPLALSLLGAKTEGPGQFLAELQQTLETAQAFSARHAGVVSLHQLEIALPSKSDAGVFHKAQALVAAMGLPIFWEAPAHAAEETIELLAEHNAAAEGALFGYKLRTGGVTADVFPPSQRIARALVAATQNRVPIKFTAGLHHPVRQYREEVQTTMHGFLNVIGAGICAAQHRWDEKQTVAMLESKDAADFSVGDEYFQWREWKVSAAQIARHRKLITSFGSCSFDEPREDLRTLRLL